MIDPNPNSGPTDPATSLDLQAEGLRKTNAMRQARIVELAKEIAELSNRVDRDAAFADQYEAAAAELRTPKVVITSVSLGDIVSGKGPFA